MNRAGERVPRRRTAGLVGLLIWVLVMLGLTILPSLAGGFAGFHEPEPWNILKSVPFQTIIGQLDDPWLLLRQSGGNLVMFLPFGFLAPMLWPDLARWWRGFACTVGIAAAISLLVESAQLGMVVMRFGTPRVADVSDVILNAAGAAVGWGLFTMVDRMFADTSWWTETRA